MQVRNQSSPLVNYNAFLADPALQDALDRYGASWALDDVVCAGRIAGNSEFLALARDVRFVLKNVVLFHACRQTRTARPSRRTTSKAVTWIKWSTMMPITKS